ncbi:DEAD/DEAH box helicase family protein [Phaeodactylibacter luteus]|uniref:DEAD/DEAH box helicase n=1 Tax=Phaeodactylibacter luteus TaxID=1564516 RepID=A0A5C6RJ24_9BACT|nr:DEAD/DEAH box helicase family protein [Phaeodactylibacter luteus]TXB62123.1 DEAD/DEAH box helicase [Phaeodactylibacter luteus]
MLELINFPESNEYRTGSANEPIGFFLEVLPKSKRFDLLLGYFSSSAINLLSIGFAQFLYNGGTVRMISNHVLSPKDRKAIEEGLTTSESQYEFSISDYAKIKSTLNEYGRHFFRCLAWLISSKKLEVLIVKPKGARGIAHYKSGVFYDEEGRAVKFKSSCNFTAYGLLENLEELEVKIAWGSRAEQAAIEEYERYFNQIWHKDAPFVDYLATDEVELLIAKDFGGHSIEELIVDEQKLLRKKRQLISNYKVRSIIDRLEEEMEQRVSMHVKEPYFPYEKPRAYQDKAYENWKARGYKGIFAMATGTGKTLTALNAVLREHKKLGQYQAIILVPTIELVNQWEDEVRGFNYRNIIKVSSQNKNWRDDLQMVSILSADKERYSFIIITTYRSFTHRRFQKAIKMIPEDTILIADEAHNLGSKSILPLLEGFPIKKRIGLSATPDRVYDKEGTAAIDSFFEDTPPYTFEYPMKQALESGFLCEYKYYPILVELTPEELEEYSEISAKLAQFWADESEESKEMVERLLLARKQIIHKAANKLAAFDKLVEELSKLNKLNYTLVYAPEGYFGDLFVDTERLGNLDKEENRICEIYSNHIRQISPDTKVALFHGATKDRASTLDSFAQSDIDVLVSMKCLDEGVDVPRTEQAIFCASTGNPRQFIQRRGRILRKAPNKTLATIYDLVVVPSTEHRVGNYNTEKRLIENELKRVYEFAGLAINHMEALQRLKPVLNLYDIIEEL